MQAGGQGQSVTWVQRILRLSREPAEASTSLPTCTHSSKGSVKVRPSHQQIEQGKLQKGGLGGRHAVRQQPIGAGRRPSSQASCVRLGCDPAHLAVAEVVWESVGAEARVLLGVEQQAQKGGGRCECGTRSCRPRRGCRQCRLCGVATWQRPLPCLFLLLLLLLLKFQQLLLRLGSCSLVPHQDQMGVKQVIWAQADLKASSHLISQRQTSSPFTSAPSKNS